MMAASTTTGSADWTMDVEVSSSAEQSGRTSVSGEVEDSRGPAPQTSADQVSNSSSSLIVQPPGPQIKSNAVVSSSSPFVLRPSKLNPTSSTNTASASKQPAQESDQQTPTLVPLEREASSGDTQTPPEPVEKKQESAGQGPPVSSSAFIFGSMLRERAVPSEGFISTTGGFAGAKRKLGESQNGDEEAKKALVVESGEALPLLPQQVITGEEDEVNVLDIQCRLFVFGGASRGTGPWIERGRGPLRLNDSKDSSQPPSSRLIIRRNGSLGVMLNTRIWEGMKIEKAGDKHVRLMAVDLANNATTASDAGSTNALKVFLIMTTSVQDAVKLTSALESRVGRITQEEGRK